MKHAQTCRACAAEFEFLNRTRRALERHASPPAPDLYLEGVLALIHERMEAPRQLPAPRRWSLRRETSATAFMASLALVWIAGVSGRFNSPTRSPKRILAATHRNVASATSPSAARLLLVEGIGFIASDSSLMRLPPGFLRDAGLVTIATLHPTGAAE
jgi:anti-sigma factor RsiW